MEKEPLKPRLLRTNEAAAYLAISPWTIRNMVHEGELQTVPGKYFRFDIRELDRWVDENLGADERPTTRAVPRGVPYLGTRKGFATVKSKVT